ncbi:interleukin-17B isoform X2 [Pleurodeles waltl]|uniref:interleukin-17B isoform X2 n=1 Tax=Pleurodeles waltl TaxID=8319 RepID=UPI003709683F
MTCSWKLIIFVAISVLVPLVICGAHKHKPKAGKGRKKGRHLEIEQAEGQSPDVIPFEKISTDPLLRVNSPTTAGSRDYTPLDEYEHSLQDMVAQLRNHSQASGGKCEVNLRLWMSNKRSLSPWAYGINHDESRIPVDIPEARCLCTGCINPFTMQEDRSMSSIPIYAKIPVRRLLCPREVQGKKSHRKKKKCQPEYQTVMENIVIGCTCIF